MEVGSKTHKMLKFKHYWQIILVVENFCTHIIEVIYKITDNRSALCLNNIEEVSDSRFKPLDFIQLVMNKCFLVFLLLLPVVYIFT